MNQPYKNNAKGKNNRSYIWFTRLEDSPKVFRILKDV